MIELGMAANPPPRFTLHHMPTEDGELVPDCLCESCSEVRRAWVDAQPEKPLLERTSALGDPLCPDCGRCYVMAGDDCPVCRAQRFVHDKLCTCPACAMLYSGARPVRSWTAQRLTCSRCRRDLGSIMATTDAVLSVCCMGCERETR